MRVSYEMNIYEFRDAFTKMGRESHFSYPGIRILFEYLEELQDGSSQPLELDIIALCCEYVEMSQDEIIEYNSLEFDEDDDEETRAEGVRAFLQENTSVCGEWDNAEDGVTFVFASF